MTKNKKNLTEKELAEIALLTAKIISVNNRREIIKTIYSLNFRKLVDTLIDAFSIHGYAKGRSKDDLRSYIMRLMHLGLMVHMYNDIGTPALTANDCLVIVSNEGKNAEKINTAKKIGAKIILITADNISSAAKVLDQKNGDILINICDKDSIKNLNAFFSKKLKKEIIVTEYAPLGTLFENATYELLNCIISAIKTELNETEEKMKKRHINY